MQFNLVLKPCKAVLTLLLQREPLAFLKTWSIAAYPGGREDTKSEPWVLRKSNEINLGRSLSGQKGMGKTNPQPLTKNLDSSDVPRTFFSHFWISPLPFEKLWRGQGSPLGKHVQWLTCVFCVPVGRERHRLLRPKRRKRKHTHTQRKRTFHVSCKSHWHPSIPKVPSKASIGVNVMATCQIRTACIFSNLRAKEFKY